MRRARHALPALALLAAAVVAPPSGTAAGVPATCDGMPATIVGTDAGETVTGTPGDDVIAALGGDDVVDALGGNDVVCGDDGADVLRGGTGADRLLGGLEDTDPDERLAGDTLWGGPGDDALDPGFDPSGHPDRDAIRWGDATRGVTLDLGDGVTGSATGWGRDTLVLTGGPLLVGTRYADTFRGSPGRDRVKDGPGADVLTLAGGDDELRLGAGPDVARLGAGDDTVFTYSNHDRVFLGPGRDQFSGYGVDDVEVHGQGGSDYVTAALGPGPGPLLRGDGGEDHLMLRSTYASDPLRTVVVDAAARTGPVVGFETFMFFESAHWDFRGTAGPDLVQATGYDLRLTAHTYGGDDHVEGGDARDVIDTGAGHDEAFGGAGRDTCLHAEVRSSCEVLH